MSTRAPAPKRETGCLNSHSSFQGFMSPATTSYLKEAHHTTMNESVLIESDECSNASNDVANSTHS